MTAPLSRLRRLPPEGGDASGRAKPVPRRLLAWTWPLCAAGLLRSDGYR